MLSLLNIKLNINSINIISVTPNDKQASNIPIKNKPILYTVNETIIPENKHTNIIHKNKPIKAKKDFIIVIMTLYNPCIKLYSL